MTTQTIQTTNKIFKKLKIFRWLMNIQMTQIFK